MDGPSRRPTDSSRSEGTPSLSEVPSGGAKTFWLLLGRLPKVTRCKSGTLSGRYRSNGYVHTPSQKNALKAPDTDHSTHTKSHTSPHPKSHHNPDSESASETPASSAQTPGDSGPAYTHTAETPAPPQPPAATQDKTAADTCPASSHQTRPRPQPRTNAAKATEAPDRSCANTQHPNARAHRQAQSADGAQAHREPTQSAHQPVLRHTLET